METRASLESLCCVNEECKENRQRGKGNLRVRKEYGQDQIRYLKCSKCGAEFSERKGTALFNCKIAESKAVSIIDHLDSRNGVTATARLVKAAKDTVSRLSRLTGRVFRGLHNVLAKDTLPQALQFD
jgi:transposase-like protein